MLLGLWCFKLGKGWKLFLRLRGLGSGSVVSSLRKTPMAARMKSGSTTAKFSTSQAIITPLSPFDCACDDSDLGYAGDDPEFRRESWPWAAWLKLYMPDLLLTVYRAARRDASLSHNQSLYFHQLQNPERFLDSVSEFHHSNFCDVRILRFEGADTASSAGTPAQTKRQRR